MIGLKQFITETCNLNPDLRLCGGRRVGGEARRDDLEEGHILLSARELAVGGLRQAVLAAELARGEQVERRPDALFSREA